MSELFRSFSQKISTMMGSPWAFFIAVILVVAWALSGQFFHYSDTWELVINTATTIITFLMVFIIQNSQNRDMKSLHLKMDELIRATHKARNSLVNLEYKSEHDIEELEKEFSNLEKSNRELKEKLRKTKNST